MSNRRKQDPEFAAKPGECVLNNYKKLREMIKPGFIKGDIIR